MLNKKATRLHFEQTAKDYDTTAVLEREVAKRLCERLDYIKLQPQKVLDAGSGTGFLSKNLLKRYSGSEVIAVDMVHSMSLESKKTGSWRRKPKVICADAEQLPIKSDSLDLVISNLMLPWCNDLVSVFGGFHRVLAPSGLLLFTTFGPDTLTEMRQSWSQLENAPQMSQFIDMHDIGDALLKSGFIDPVTDMELITMTYANVSQLMRDTKQIGVSEYGDNDKGQLALFEQAYEKLKTADGLYPVSWEIIYGHAWLGEGIKLDNFENVIPIQKV